MILPGTMQAMVKNLITHHQQSVVTIAKQTGISATTIQRILVGKAPSRRTQMQLIRYYCRVCI